MKSNKEEDDQECVGRSVGTLPLETKRRQKKSIAKLIQKKKRLAVSGVGRVRQRKKQSSYDTAEEEDQVLHH